MSHTDTTTTEPRLPRVERLLAEIDAGPDEDHIRSDGSWSNCSSYCVHRPTPERSSLLGCCGEPVIIEHAEAVGAKLVCAVTGNDIMHHRSQDTAEIVRGCSPATRLYGPGVLT